MSDWKPEPNRAVDVTKLPLNAEEGFVLSRLDGRTELGDVATLTGFPRAKVQGIVERLVACGAVQGPPGPPMARVTPPPVEPLAEEVPPVDDEAAAPVDEVEDGNHRALFERTLHALAEDQRVARALVAVDPELTAFTYDPVPAVVRALLQNPRAGLSQARLIARHHRNPVGLEAVAARAAFAADVGVRRWLTRNPQLPASLLRRLFAGQRLLVQFKLSVDRDIPEGTRRTARELLRARFSSGPAEERVELILKTEGRALMSLSGLTFDGKTTALLCGRSYGSTMLVQNLARFSATPPPLIAHLLRQDLVKRQPQLRAALQRHPNAPGDRLR